MWRLVGLLFVIVPAIELVGIVAVARRIGFGPTLLLLAGVALVGGLVARAQGSAVVREVRRAAAEGRAPEEGLVGGLLVLLAGALLVVPGFVTDFAGGLLLVPPVRRRVSRALAAALERRLRGLAGGVGARGPNPAPAARDARVIDVSYEEKPRDEPPGR